MLGKKVPMASKPRGEGLKALVTGPLRKELFCGFPFGLRSIKKTAHAHNVFFGFVFSASLELRVDEIK